METNRLHSRELGDDNEHLHLDSRFCFELNFACRRRLRVDPLKILLLTHTAVRAVAMPTEHQTRPVSLSVVKSGAD